MRLIAAVDEGNGIGLNGELPWRCSEDLRWFKFITTGCVLIVGRKTFHTMKDLQDRGFLVVSSMDTETAIDLQMKYRCSIVNYFPTFDRSAIICGGASIYEQAFANQVVDEVYLSRISGIHEADTYFYDPWLDNFKKTTKLVLSKKCVVEKWIRS